MNIGPDALGRSSVWGSVPGSTVVVGATPVVVDAAFVVLVAAGRVEVGAGAVELVTAANGAVLVTAASATATVGGRGDAGPSATSAVPTSAARTTTPIVAARCARCSSSTGGSYAPGGPNVTAWTKTPTPARRPTSRPASVDAEGDAPEVDARGAGNVRSTGSGAAPRAR